MTSRFTLVWTGILACVVAEAAPLRAQDAIQDACMTTISGRVKGKEREVQKVQRLGDASQSASTPTHMMLKGKGQFENRAGDWTPFDYSCMYDTQKGRVLSSGYTVKGTDKGAVAPDYPLNRSQPWASACEGAVRNKIQYETSSPKVKFYDATEREFEASDVGAGVRGQGEFKGRDGALQHFGFNCVYDKRSGHVTTADYQPK